MVFFCVYTMYVSLSIDMYTYIYFYQSIDRSGCMIYGILYIYIYVYMMEIAKQWKYHRKCLHLTAKHFGNMKG
jgi:hypothetical protein